MLIGYARVSTRHQTIDMQTDALKAAGCEEIFTDRASGAAAQRDGLEKCLNYIRPGDTLVVWKIDRLGRSIANLVRTLDQLRRDGIHFKSITESIDTNTPFGKAIFGIIAALTEMERDLIIERTHAGLEAARKRGKKSGAKPKITGKIEEAILDWQRRGLSVDKIAEATGMKRSTLYRYFKKQKESATPQPERMGDRDRSGAATPPAAPDPKATGKNISRKRTA